jgi:hypothetical protein
MSTVATRKKKRKEMRKAMAQSERESVEEEDERFAQYGGRDQRNSCKSPKANHRSDDREGA